MFDEVSDGIGYGCLEGDSAGIQAGEVYANELTWFKHSCLAGSNYSPQPNKMFPRSLKECKCRIADRGQRTGKTA